MKNDIYEVPEATGVFIDAAVTDPFSKLVFASLWGHTAAIQNTLARITAGELKSMTISGQQIAVDKEMVKKAGKLPADNDYGDMTHTLIYRNTAIDEQAGQRDLLFYGKSPDRLIFQAVRSMSVLPMMESWLECLLKHLRDNDMLIDLVTVCGEVNGIHINLGNEDELGYMLSQHVQSGKLEVNHAVG